MSRRLDRALAAAQLLRTVDVDALRKEIGVSVAAVAVRAGVGYGTLTDWRGNRHDMPRLPLLLAVLEALVSLRERAGVERRTAGQHARRSCVTGNQEGRAIARRR